MILKDIEGKNLNNGVKLSSPKVSPTYKRQFSDSEKLLTVDGLKKVVVTLLTHIQCKNAEGCYVKVEFLPITFT